MEQINYIRSIDKFSLKNFFSKYYLFVFLFIGNSSVPFLRNYYFNYFFIIIFIGFLKNVLNENKYVMLYIIFYLSLEIYHYFYFFGIYDFAVVRRLILAFIVSYLFSQKFNELRKFIHAYVKIIYGLSLISLIIYALFISNPQIILNFEELFKPFFIVKVEHYGQDLSQINPLFYNFDYNLHLMNRNNGPFWEPTIFAFNLFLAIFFNFIITKKVINKYSVVFILAYFTTFSTTGILALFLFLFLLFFLNNKINFVARLLILFMFVSSSTYIIVKNSFLLEKIVTEFNQVDDTIDSKGGDSRLASLYLDWDEMVEETEYILFGKGYDIDSRIKGSDKDILRNNGLSASFIQIGIICTIIYFICIYLFCSKLCKLAKLNSGLAFAFFVGIIVFSFSESILEFTLIKSFAFMGISKFTIYEN